MTQAEKGTSVLNIGLIAHDSKKELMQNFCIAYKRILSKQELFATGTTGGLIEDATGLEIHKFLAGQLGGGRQMSAQIECNEIDAVIELEDGDWCAFEIKLGAKKIDEGAANLNKVCGDIEKNGGKAPRIKCVICGLSNAAYQRPDGVFVVPITALKD